MIQNQNIFKSKTETYRWKQDMLSKFLMWDYSCTMLPEMFKIPNMCYAIKVTTLSNAKTQFCQVNFKFFRYPYCM